MDNGSSTPPARGGPTEQDWTEDQWRQCGMIIGRLDGEGVEPTPDVCRALVVWINAGGPE